MLTFIRKVRDGYAILVQQLVTHQKKKKGGGLQLSMIYRGHCQLSTIQVYQQESSMCS